MQQGEIYAIGESLWIVVDNFHANSDRYPSVHCAPVLNIDEIRLQLDVPLAFQQGFVSLGLLEKVPKSALSSLRAIAHPAELQQIRRNLVTWFSYYSFIDLDAATPEPATPEQAPLIQPGMIFRYEKELICVIDHWGCFNEYPLLYVGPVVPNLADPSPLDVDISSQFRDLFSDSYYVRAGEFFLVERESLETTYTPEVPMLTYGYVHRISRSMALEFGELGLLL